MDEGKLGRLMALVGVGAVMAFPLAAEAKPGNGGGGSNGGKEKAEKPEKENGKPDKGPDGEGETETETAVDPSAAAEPVPAKGRGHQLYRGKVTAVDSTAGTVTVTIVHGNRGGRARVGQSVAFDVSAATLLVPDRTVDGLRNIEDLAVGDRLKVSARGTTATTGAPLAATRVQADGSGHTAPPKPDEESEPEEEAPEPEEESPDGP